MQPRETFLKSGGDALLGEEELVGELLVGELLTCK